MLVISRYLEGIGAGISISTLVVMEALARITWLSRSNTQQIELRFISLLSNIELFFIDYSITTFRQPEKIICIASQEPRNKKQRRVET